MLRESKAFSCVLASMKLKAKESSIVQLFTLRHSIEGDTQTFLQSYADKCKQQNINQLFTYPVQWKSIAIEASYRFKMEFDEVEFDCILRGIKVNRSFSQGSEKFTYQLVFEKDFDSELDSIFSTYLNQKQINELGKKVLIEYSVYLTPIESLMKEQTKLLAMHSPVYQITKMTN